MSNPAPVQSAIPEHLQSQSLDESPLTKPQVALALDNLRSYLSDSYPSSLPFTFYTFRALSKNNPVDRTAALSILGSRPPLSSSIRPVNTFSDPTSTVALLLTDGVEVRIPEKFSIPAAQMHLLLDSLPTHNYQIIDLVLVRHTKLAAAARQFNTSSSTISRRVSDALNLLASFLYSSRWPSPPSTPVA